MTSERKLTHVEICRDQDVNYRLKPTHLADVELVHIAAPELDLSDIDLSVKMFGKTLSAPIIISAMTGGHPETKRINENLAKAASELGIGMGVGSQRAALEDPALEGTFRVVREVSKDMLTIANLGAAQILSSNAKDMAVHAIEMVDADALAIHLNPLQELVQPGGDLRYKGVLKGMKKLSQAIAVPLIVKETGCGISMDVARDLHDAGVKAVDVGGAGGTSWAAVEHYNAHLQGDQFKADVAETFWDWGIPTAMSICEVATILPKPSVLIASGGISDGLDVAKSISLGADLAGIARPILIPAFEGADKVKAKLERMIYELKIAAMLTGSRNVRELQSAKVVLGGDLLNWIVQRRIKIRQSAEA
jgi:isopentenyl-diphosphate delta-isomerase